jgi:hypothetical protein
MGRTACEPSASHACESFLQTTTEKDVAIEPFRRAVRKLTAKYARSRELTIRIVHDRAFYKTPQFLNLASLILTLILALARLALQDSPYLPSIVFPTSLGLLALPPSMYEH